MTSNKACKEIEETLNGIEGIKKAEVIHTGLMKRELQIAVNEDMSNDDILALGSLIGSISTKY